MNQEGLTVGGLRVLLEGVEDDMPVVVWNERYVAYEQASPSASGVGFVGDDDLWESGGGYRLPDTQTAFTIR